ncbi:hypothetical protein PC116_g6350 [Phytophthora cactorum]|nr:hypothetical protein PC111_g6854 [Phytophthora cactorum]KAG3024544.1 hypothetical protein PC120_g7004 [Phytophthora cactorum]KAG3071339.1 hypothetical protein PC121_g9260 [Phytophthora cactorum]KAG4058311.1 hypothetical protein PC123_g6723 [Phytophthora cactorum]KAG4245901.1 hypothetical protein PC116_g6350 [Phytophthora cactorum]
MQRIPAVLQRLVMRMLFSMGAPYKLIPAPPAWMTRTVLTLLHCLGSVARPLTMAYILKKPRIVKNTVNVRITWHLSEQ